MKRPRSGLLDWMTQASFPVYAVDTKRRIRFVNRGCETLVGVEAIDLVGSECIYSSEPNNTQRELLLAALCPPREALEGTPSTRSVSIPDSNEKAASKTFEARYIPLDDTSGTLKAVLVLLAPSADHVSQSSRSEIQSLHSDLLKLRLENRSRFGFAALDVQSSSTRKGARIAKLAATSLEPVHFVGARGVGKMHWARAVHSRSENGVRSFVPMDCRRLTSIQIRRILKRLTNFDDGDIATEMAPGTLFLSHVDHLGLDLQIEIRDLFRDPGFQVRLMTSSNESLQPMVAEERFDAEFLDDLSTISLTIPSLIERMDDLPVLAQAMLERCNKTSLKQVDGFGADVLREFQAYDWPANLTELHAVVREAHGNAEQAFVQISDLPFRFRAGMDALAVSPGGTFEAIDLESYLGNIETAKIREAIDACKQNKSKAAEMLGMTRAKLYRRMEQLGMTDEG